MCMLADPTPESLRGSRCSTAARQLLTDGRFARVPISEAPTTHVFFNLFSATWCASTERAETNRDGRRQFKRVHRPPDDVIEP
jgi:hypothetical protein